MYYEVKSIQWLLSLSVVSNWKIFDKIIIYIHILIEDYRLKVKKHSYTPPLLTNALNLRAAH